MDQLPDVVYKTTPIAVQCICGKIINIEFNKLRNKRVKSCGCIISYTRKSLDISNKKSREQWLRQCPQLIDVDLPGYWHAGSNITVSIKCDKSHIYQCRFNRLTTARCKECYRINLDEIYNKSFGKLRLIKSDTYGKLTTKSKLNWLCECGNTTTKILYNVMSGHSKSCGDCNLKPKEWWTSQKFGHLKVVDLYKSVTTGSETKLKCVCSCGNTTYKQADQLANFKVTTCGLCSLKLNEWWHNKPTLSEYLRSECSKIYSVDILKRYFGGYSITPLSYAQSTRSIIDVGCNLCGNTFKTTLASLIYQKVKSCGCLSHIISKPAYEIGTYIKSLGCDIIYEFRVNGLPPSDILVCKPRIIIEYDGEYYHKNKNYRDMWKQDSYQRLGFMFIRIVESEWKNNKDAVKKQLEQLCQ